MEAQKNWIFYDKKLCSMSGREFIPLGIAQVKYLVKLIQNMKCG